MTEEKINEALVRKAPQSTEALLELLFEGLGWPRPSGMEIEDIPLLDWSPDELHLNPNEVARLRKIQQLPNLTAKQPFGVFILSFDGGRLPVGAVRRVVDRLVRKRRARTKAAKTLWDLNDLIFFCQSSNGVGTLHVVAFRDTDSSPVMKVISWDTKSVANKIELISSQNLPSLAWPEKGQLDTHEWRDQWMNAFTAGYREGIKSSSALAAKMAEVARVVRDEVIALYAVETQDGPLRQLFDDVKKNLRADLTPDDFADMYAQTMVYGLLTARITHPEDFEADAINSVLKFENPFLDALYSGFKKQGDKLFDVDEFGLHDLAELLARTNMDEVLADFGTAEKKDDPVVFFYEEFLEQYDPEQRKALGAYYTPIPIVRFMVRAVDEIIKNEFGLPLGVADQTTWSEYSKTKKIKIPTGVKPSDKVVRMIDPATGTGTFLLEWMRQAERNLRANRSFSNDTMKSVVEQMDAFEISLSSYSVAHLKTSLELDKELRSQVQIGIRLTDSLAGRSENQLELFDDNPIAVEGKKSEEVKFDQNHSVVIGNPPYLRTNRESGGGWLLHPSDSGRPIFEDFLNRALAKTKFGHTRSLFNLYTYFWRWGLWKAFEQSGGPSVVSFITASSWLSGPGFLGMREMAREFGDEVFVVDLGGDNLGTRVEENVFPIQIPVAIVFIVSRGLPKDGKRLGRVRYLKVSGSRHEKLATLDDLTIDSGNWLEVIGNGHSPLIPSTGTEAWSTWPLISDLFPLQQPGCKWAKTWPYATTRQVLEDRWKLFMSKTSVKWREEAFVTGKTGRKITTQVGDLKKLVDEPSKAKTPPIARYSFRSFDRQWALVDERISDGFRPTLWSSATADQVFITTSITGKLGSGPAATVSTFVCDYHHFNGRGGKDIVPMFRDGQKTPNIDNELLIRLSAVFQVEYRIDAESLFAYTFGILAGTDYTSRFTSELETPGPRIPITRDYQLFTQMVEFGKKLLWLQTFGERFEGKNRQTLKVSSEIRWKRKPTRLPEDLQDFSYVESEGCIYIADGALIGVPEHVWKFEVSGMQIIKKWLGYRTAKGTGRAAQSSSVLDRVRPTEWESAWSDELREIVHVLVETEKMRKIGTGILEEITSGALIKSEDLPEPPEELRNPPPTNSFGGLFDSQ